MGESLFHRDVRQAEENLSRENRRGFWTRVFTLGLVDNDERITVATKELEACRSSLAQYQHLRSQATELDRLLSETIELHGVRVSKQIFADIPVLNTADYGSGWEQLRDLILTRDGYECQEADGHCDGPLQIHHVIALSRGGTNDPNNLETLCFYHHSLKHDHMRGEYSGSIWG